MRYGEERTRGRKKKSESFFSKIMAPVLKPAYVGSLAMYLVRISQGNFTRERPVYPLYVFCYLFVARILPAIWQLPSVPVKRSGCVCMCMFMKLRITAQSGPVILVILCRSRWSSSQGGINENCIRKPLTRLDKGPPQTFTPYFYA